MNRVNPPRLFSLLSMTLIAVGVLLSIASVRWQLVSMASFHAGVALVMILVATAMLRRQRPRVTDTLLLSALLLVGLGHALLPMPVQDTLVYLLP